MTEIVEDNYALIPHPNKPVPWAQPGWFDEASAWIEQQLASRGYSIVAPIEQLHVRVWSTILRVSTSSGRDTLEMRPCNDAGLAHSPNAARASSSAQQGRKVVSGPNGRVFYFKASGPSFAYEPAITQVLSEHWPACIPHVIAVDTERTWILMEDAGRPLRELLLAGDKMSNRAYLERALALYAQFQIESAVYRETLLSLGCPDRSLHVLPMLFEQVVADTPVLLVGRKGGVSEAELEQLRNFTPQVQMMCDELASYHLPQTLHHDDFHTNNILINERGYVFFDWGDAAITHPFISMFVALRSAKYRLEYDDDALLRLRDAYLEPWSTYATKSQLLAAFEVAQRLGIFSRALTWYQIVTSLEERAIGEFEDAVPYWLKMFLTNEEPDEM